MSVPIKFGTDGWRAIIARDFTVDNVTRVAEATAEWLLKKKKKAQVVIGHDCRFGGRLFSETVAAVMCSYGVKTFLADTFVSTPMISLATVKLNFDLGIIITASHNPAEYNGYKLKGSYGGPLIPAHISEIESLIKPAPTVQPATSSLEAFRKQGLLADVNLEDMYVEEMERNFDLELIRSCRLRWAYDAMYGAGQNVMRRLFPDITLLHCEYNPSFKGQAPEPIHKNLQELSMLIKNSGTIDCGLATDGDADRLGLYDARGHFIDSHHIILLLIHYLVKYKGMRGKVCTAFSTTPRVEKLCRHYGLPYEVVKIGFKWICEIMIRPGEDVLLGGEESGGIALKGHIPERDGLWVGLTLWEFMARSGKSLQELIREVYDIVGPFTFERIDLHIPEEVKQRVLNNCRAGVYKAFGNYKIVRMEDLDGYKYFFENGDWLMIRASGTEPVLRTYAESDSRENALAILKAGHQTLLN
jgi:phosphomannomutase